MSRRPWSPGGSGRNTKPFSAESPPYKASDINTGWILAFRLFESFDVMTHSSCLHFDVRLNLNSTPKRQNPS